MNILIIDNSVEITHVKTYKQGMSELAGLK